MTTLTPAHARALHTLAARIDTYRWHLPDPSPSAESFDVPSLALLANHLDQLHQLAGSTTDLIATHIDHDHLSLSRQRLLQAVADAHTLISHATVHMAEVLQARALLDRTRSLPATWEVHDRRLEAVRRAAAAMDRAILQLIDASHGLTRAADGPGQPTAGSRPVPVSSAAAEPPDPPLPTTRPTASPTAAPHRGR